MGSNVTNDIAVGDFAVLGKLVFVNEETHVCYLNISDTLEYATGIILHCPGLLWFVFILHQVSVLLVFSNLW